MGQQDVQPKEYVLIVTHKNGEVRARILILSVPPKVTDSTRTITLDEDMILDKGSFTEPWKLQAIIGRVLDVTSITPSVMWGNGRKPGMHSQVRTGDNALL